MSDTKGFLTRAAGTSSYGAWIECQSVQECDYINKEALGGLGDDGSEVKSTDCLLFQSSEFNSQQPCGGSQPSEMRSGALF